jgi:hypothetical protein
MNEHFTRPKKASSADKKKQKPKKGAQDRLGSMLMELEQRIAFDAAGAATVDHVKDEHAAKTGEATDAPHHADAGDRDSDALSKALAAVPEAGSANPQPVDEVVKQVVVVDSSVPDYQSLLQGIDGDFEVIVLQKGRDGVEQLAEALSHMKNVDQIHIISHGDEGRLYLGSAELTISKPRSPPMPTS